MRDITQLLHTCNMVSLLSPALLRVACPVLLSFVSLWNTQINHVGAFFNMKEWI